MKKITLKNMEGWDASHSLNTTITLALTVSMELISLCDRKCQLTKGGKLQKHEMIVDGILRKQ